MFARKGTNPFYSNYFNLQNAFSQRGAATPSNPVQPTPKSTTKHSTAKWSNSKLKKGWKFIKSITRPLAKITDPGNLVGHPLWSKRLGKPNKLEKFLNSALYTVATLPIGGGAAAGARGAWRAAPAAGRFTRGVWNQFRRFGLRDFSRGHYHAL